MRKLIPEARSERLALKNAIDRCHRPNHQAWKNYGGRGITVCDEWRNSFMAFYNHIGPKPNGKYDLDRIDNDRGYEPGNVRWATRQSNTRNKRKSGNSYLIALELGYSSVAEACENIGISNSLFTWRVKHGYTKDTITLPPNDPEVRKVNKHVYDYKYKTSTGMSMQEACNMTGVKYQCAYKRLTKYGWDIDSACGL